MNRDELITVKNRTNGSVGYTLENATIQGGRIVRTFKSGESRQVPFWELQECMMSAGGRQILTDYLVIDNREAIKELFSDELEPEYFYDENKVQQLLEKGSLDQLEDCLNYAPDGVIELIKKIAVDIKINDINKRELITKKTGFNVNNAIKNEQEDIVIDSSNSEVKTTSRSKRKAKVFEESSNTSTSSNEEVFVIEG